MKARRCDRNHVVYLMMNKITGDSYVGVTAVGGGIRATLKERFRRHLSRALHEEKDWKMHVVLRQYPDPEMWTKEVLDRVRGRKPAHQRERELTRELNPTLNTF